MNRPYWITGGQALIEGKPRRDYSVLVENGRIAAVGEAREAAGDVRRLRDDQWLLPGLIDVQANGGGGVLFNDAPERLGEIIAAHRALEVASIMPTLITDAPALMHRAVAAVLAAGDDVVGLHLEGPFISSARPGIHHPGFIRKMEPEDVLYLCDLAARLAPGKLLITLAPEEVDDAHLTALARAGVILSIGHTVASYERCREALALGVRGFTHLWNAMPGPTARAPGPVIAALEQGFCGVIADRIHVDRANLAHTLSVKRAGTVFLVSDAMSVAGSGISGFSLQGRRIHRDSGRLLGEDGTLAGADLDLRTAVTNAVEWLGLGFWQAWTMASEIPAKFLGLADRGRIAPGCRAGFVIDSSPSFAISMNERP